VLWVASQVVMLRDGNVVAEGPPDAVVTRQNLCRLYQAEVEVWQLLENFKICVPQRRRSRLCDCERHDKHRPVLGAGRCCRRKDAEV